MADRLAQNEARRAAFTAKIEDLGPRRERLAARLDKVMAQLDALGGEAPGLDALPAAEAAQNDAADALARARRDQNAAEAARADAAERIEKARASHQVTAEDAARHRAKAEALADIVGGDDAERWPPVIDQLTVQPGHEIQPRKRAVIVSGLEDAHPRVKFTKLHLASPQSSKRQRLRPRHPFCWPCT